VKNWKKQEEGEMKDIPYGELKEFAESLLHKVGDLSSKNAYLKTELRKAVKVREYLENVYSNSALIGCIGYRRTPEPPGFMRVISEAIKNLPSKIIFDEDDEG
jgi:hypothetical protein